MEHAENNYYLKTLDKLVLLMLIALLMMLVQTQNANVDFQQLVLNIVTLRGEMIYGLMLRQL